MATRALERLGHGGLQEGTVLGNLLQPWDPGEDAPWLQRFTLHTCTHMLLHTVAASCQEESQKRNPKGHHVRNIATTSS